MFLTVSAPLNLTKNMSCKAVRPLRQSGMTLVELLVAMVIGMLISLAAVSALIVTREGFSAVDASSQLRDNARYASELIQRIALQTGFKDPVYVVTRPSQSDTAADASGLISANVTGFNNSLFKITDLTTATARTASVVGYGSDVLILKYQTAKLNDDTSSVADGSMIDCAGHPITTIPMERNDRMVSAFYVALDAIGEPSLYCGSSSNGLAPYTPQPIVKGVENLQVLYGVDGFTTVNTAFSGTPDSVPETYLRADQIVIAGDPSSKATYDNWRRVRSIRIGMVIRGPLNSQQSATAGTPYYPFGLAKDSAGGTLGSALSSASDIGTIFIPPADGRLRQVVTFTIHLRNDQSL